MIGLVAAAVFYLGACGFLAWELAGIYQLFHGGER